jgi:hypothetical protein
VNIDTVITQSCERIPGLQRAALVSLPDGFLLGATRGAKLLDLEPLVRSAAACVGRGDGQMAEHVFAMRDQFVVIQTGRTNPRLALIATTTIEPNIAFVLATSRAAMTEVEAAIDLADWEL